MRESPRLFPTQPSLIRHSSSNDPGKSTKIIRLNDPGEGEILVWDANIKTLKHHGLHQPISLFFQDVAYFPLFVRASYPVLASSLNIPPVSI